MRISNQLFISAFLIFILSLTSSYFAFLANKASIEFILTLGFASVTSGIGIHLIFGVFSLKKKMKSIQKTMFQLDIKNQHFPTNEVGGSDEFSVLANDLNKMIMNLKTSYFQIEKQQLDLVSSSRMASLGQMAGGFAHEINNPLHMINGTLRKLIRQIESDDFKKSQLIETVKKIEGFVYRIATIIRSLRHISRNGENDPFLSASTKKIMDDTLEIIQARLKNSSISLEIIQPEEFQIECRSVQLSQVLFHLINNSFDAIHNTVDPWIKVTLEKKGASAEISVTDSGGGIRAPIADKLMQPFFTTKEVGQGTGLGLSISKGILEAHHGDLTLDREYPNTRFVMKLPLKQFQETKEQIKKAA